MSSTKMDIEAVAFKSEYAGADIQFSNICNKLFIFLTDEGVQDHQIGVNGLKNL